MKTFNNSIINLYKVKNNKKELMAIDLMAKLETKSFGVINELGIRTYEEGVLIYIERRDVKEFEFKELEWNSMLIERIRIDREEVDEWYQVDGVKIRESGNKTIVFKGTRKNNFTNTFDKKEYAVV